MTINDAISGIKSHRQRMMHEDDRAIEAIRNGDYATAAMAVACAAAHKGAIEELQFQLEMMEVKA